MLVRMYENPNPSVLLRSLVVSVKVLSMAYIIIFLGVMKSAVGEIF